MSFIVVYRGAGAGSSCQELGTLDDAVRFVERIRNDAGVSDAQIFRAEPVPFDFRPYFRVEITDAPVGLPKPTRYSRDMLLAPDDAAQLEDTVPAMEAAPVGHVTPATNDGEAPGRGLFGR